LRPKWISDFLYFDSTARHQIGIDIFCFFHHHTAIIGE
jgi:hypothetical protein